MQADETMAACGHPLPAPGEARITVDLKADVVAVTHSPFNRRDDGEFFCTHYSVSNALALAHEIMDRVASARTTEG
jgi:hypothetical protein